jgi:hypothetical protein
MIIYKKTPHSYSAFLTNISLTRYFYRRDNFAFPLLLQIDLFCNRWPDTIVKCYTIYHNFLRLLTDVGHQ